MANPCFQPRRIHPRISTTISKLPTHVSPTSIASCPWCHKVPTPVSYKHVCFSMHMDRRMTSCRMPPVFALCNIPCHYVGLQMVSSLSQSPVLDAIRAAQSRKAQRMLLKQSCNIGMAAAGVSSDRATVGVADAVPHHRLAHMPRCLTIAEELVYGGSRGCLH